jgi:predicted ArsR family transcriptional regulator
MTVPPNSGSVQGSRARIIDLLRRSALTANEMAMHLGVTHNAVRGHLAALLRAGFIREQGLRRGASRPAMVYELVPETAASFSRAYIPFVAHLLKALPERMPQPELEDLMRTVGRNLAAEWPPLRGNLEQRIAAANALLEELGALTEVETSAQGFVIRGHGCLLSEAVHGRPEVCHALESLLAHLLEVPVKECCERTAHPRCCFRIERAAGAATAMV